MTRHLLSIGELTEPDIGELFELADRLRESTPHAPLLRGRTFLLFFPESSLRTRLTFERGIRELGGECVLFPPETLDKSEDLRDVAGYAANWAHGLIVRHRDYARLRQLASRSPLPVVNAMTSRNHPCEILADLYALRLRRPDFRELTYTYVGPMNNIGRSWAEAAEVLRLDFRHVCAPGYGLISEPADSGPGVGSAASSRHYTFCTELESALPHTDIVLTDSLPGELKTTEYMDKYRITPEVMRIAKPGALLNPCPPFYRGEEVSAEVIDSDYFVGYDFKEQLLTVQQAIVLLSQRGY
ncbi:ornithine carbamoyltransferase [Saccharibacillus sp. CPCC 101409]|uniref:ornithine carbamoyltransferase n=1 Tax=Saccharibacillus sp. CPCC 101409 TaxID=3058041 RepID=UPI00267283E2|nr:ornithine carbamoyltransferase [Saccharibacillus sp. CPCC 101409]MDO3408149.1 ornithine carbamoyltransferase [Saccharibacillus sp. CPCC 101409]